MILILNGSPSGRKSNCAVLIKTVVKKLKTSFGNTSPAVKTIHLSKVKWNATEKKRLITDLLEADGFIFTTGTYWDSWGSPMQLFLENVTDLEGGPAFMGKPAIVLVLNHSVGGKGVLSRLQGVLSTLGCLIPPMSGLVYSWASAQVIKGRLGGEAKKDLWSLEDLEGILQNFSAVLAVKIKWTTWPMDQKDFRKIWLRD